MPMASRTSAEPHFEVIAAIAVFGDSGSGRSGDERSAGGDVEGAEAIAAGPAGIDQFGALVGGEGNGQGKRAHGLSKASEFVNGFAARGDGGEQGSDLKVGTRVGLAGEDGVEGLASLITREGAAFLDDAFEVGLQCGHGVNLC
jgi:hypothetical protein